MVQPPDLRLPVGTAVTRRQDRPARPGGPAGVWVGEMHTVEITVQPAGLRLPAGPAIACRQDRALVPDRPAGMRVSEMHTVEITVQPAGLRIQWAPPSRVARIVPLCPTAHPVCASAK